MINEYETPKSRYFKRILFLGKRPRNYEQSEESSQRQESPSEINAVSGSKTEPLSKDKDMLLCDEMPLELRPYMTTSKKPLKTVKITHLNTLADLIGTIDLTRRHVGHELHPEIIFHSPYCPLPPHISRRTHIDPRCLSPCFKGKPEMPYSHEEQSSEYSYCQNPE
jgi:hypothetical protein